VCPRTQSFALNGRNDVLFAEKRIRLVCEKLTIFPYGQDIIGNVVLCAERCMPGGVSVCLSVSEPYFRYLTSTPNFTRFFVHVACGCGLILFWRHTSDFCR